MKLILIVYLIIITYMFMSTIDLSDDIPLTPKQIYDSSEMNMFGCIVVFLFMLVINPLYYIVYFIYWLFHAGREEDQNNER